MTGNIIAFDRGAEYWHERAIKRRESDPMDALTMLRRAAELSPEEAVYPMEAAELLSELGCPCDSILTLARMSRCGNLPPETFFGLSCNLYAMDYIDASADALALYLKFDPQGEYHEEAMYMLSSLRIAEELTLSRDRKARRAARLVKRAVTCLQQERWEQARVLLLQALRLTPTDRKAATLLAEARLKTGRHESAVRLIRKLAPGASTGSVIQMALALSPYPQHHALVRELLALLDQADLDEDERAGRMQIYINMNCPEDIKRLLPDLLALGPHDRGLMQAAAANALRNGDQENALRFWSRMQRIRPKDGIAGYYLAQPPLAQEAIPYTLRLSEDTTRELLGACRAPGDRLMELAHWALDALENQAFVLLCPALTASSDPEAEYVLREALVHPMLSSVTKQHALHALSDRGAKAPYLYCDAAHVRLYDDTEHCADQPLPRALYRLLWQADEAASEISPACRESLFTLWLSLASREPKLPAGLHLRSLTPALLALAGKRTHSPVADADLTRRFRITRRRLHHEMALLERVLREEEIPHEVH